jgi:hypothetical protein
LAFAFVLSLLSEREEEKLWFLTLPPQGSIEDWLRKGKGKNPAKLWVFTFWFLPFWAFACEALVFTLWLKTKG